MSFQYFHNFLAGIRFASLYTHFNKFLPRNLLWKNILPSISAARISMIPLCTYLMVWNPPSWKINPNPMMRKKFITLNICVRIKFFPLFTSSHPHSLFNAKFFFDLFIRSRNFKAEEIKKLWEIELLENVMKIFSPNKYEVHATSRKSAI
jgi:hypothetical protein